MQEKRWVQIASNLKGAIRSGELASGDRIATDTEMAGQWNVSRVTVQRALTELQREGWVVRRRRVGTVVADRSALPATKIALVFTTLSDRPQSDYLSGIEESLAAGYQLVPMNARRTGEGEASCLERAAAECGAVILYPWCVPENTALLNKISAAMPLILVDRIPEGVEADTVMSDNFGSMLMGLRHLHALGHRRIAYFTLSLLHISSVRERQDAAYREFMKQEIGIEDTGRWDRRFAVSMTQRQLVESFETTLAEMLSKSDPITAVVCQQGVEALLESCVHLGVRLPDDLAILTFAERSIGMPLGESVHRLVQRSVEMGHMAARRAQQRLSNPPSAGPQIMRVMTDLFPATPHEMSAVAKKYAARQMALGKGCYI